ncbi:MAG: Rod shape-determining protein mreC [uncultured bacterium]|nr:MAG: Rod shape-determining protein mreC [uncultured bacterium]
MNFIRREAKSILLAGGIFVCSIIVYAVGWLNPLERWLSVVVQPGFHVFYATLDTISPLYTTSDSALLAENTALKDLLAKEVRSNHDLQIQVSQYEEYKEQLAFAQEKNYDIIPAKIISRVGQVELNQLLLINRGSSHGMKVGYPVTYGTGLLLGTISVVHESYSEVTLTTDETSQIQGNVANEKNGASGIVSGQFGTNLIMNYILKEQSIAPDQIVITNGQDRWIPSGLILGIVQNVTDEPSDVFKSATITPLARYGNNAIVSVITPKL